MFTSRADRSTQICCCKFSSPWTYLAITKSTQLTPKQAKSTYIQMSGDRGLRKEKTPGLVPLGFRQRMLMPRVINGLEKSMTFSRTQVMVRGATARSALCESKFKIIVSVVELPGKCLDFCWVLLIFVLNTKCFSHKFL